MLDLGGRDRVVAVMVTSLDGVVALDGQSRALSSDQDRALIGAWREVADALLVGASTLAAETYGGSLFPAAARAARVRAGAPELPPIVTIDRSGRLDVDRALRAREPLALIAYTSASDSDSDGAAGADRRVQWISRADVSLAGVIGDLRARFGYRLIVAEPGPRLLKALREEHQLTDLSLTVAPILADGGLRLEPAPGAQPLGAVDVETVGGVTFVHMVVSAGSDPEV